MLNEGTGLHVQYMYKYGPTVYWSYMYSTPVHTVHVHVCVGLNAVCIVHMHVHVVQVSSKTILALGACTNNALALYMNVYVCTVCLYPIHVLSITIWDHFIIECNITAHIYANIQCMQDSLVYRYSVRHHTMIYTVHVLAWLLTYMNCGIQFIYLHGNDLTKINASVSITSAKRFDLGSHTTVLSISCSSHEGI